MDSYLLAKINKAKKTHDMTHQPQRHGYLGQTLYVDLVGPLPLSPNRNKYVLTTMDSFSKYITATPIPSKDAAVVANALMNTWSASLVVQPEFTVRIKFENRLLAQLCDHLQIAKSNIVERFHRSLNKILIVYLTHEDPSWESLINMSAFSYNTKVNTTTG